jgi:SAM-dependent methyltransferase
MIVPALPKPTHPHLQEKTALQPQWFETFFEGAFVDLWNQAMTPEATSAEVDFFVEKLELSAGARVLDVPCGNGRHAIELAKRGYRVTGVDLSKEFLEHARRNREAAGVEVELIRADMRALPDGATYEAAYCYGNSFGYLDPVSAEAFLTRIAGRLAEGGRLLLETGTVAESILPQLKEDNWYRMGDVYLLSRRQYVAEEGRLDIEYTTLREGKLDARPTSSYVQTCAELLRMLDRAGFRHEGVYGSVGGEAFRLGSRHLIVVARRE